MSLTNKIGKSIAILGLTSTLNCADEGDVHNHYYVGGDETSGSTGSGSNGGIPLENCEDLVNKLYLCSPQFFEKYEQDWGISIEDQKRHAIDECIGKDFFNRAPDYVQCIEDHTCAELNPAEHDGKPWLMACGDYAID